jgi:hypothetical protein
MWRNEILVRTDVSMERVASNITMKRISEIGATITLSNKSHCEEMLTDLGVSVLG